MDRINIMYEITQRKIADYISSNYTTRHDSV